MITTQQVEQQFNAMFAELDAIVLERAMAVKRINNARKSALKVQTEVNAAKPIINRKAA